MPTSVVTPLASGVFNSLKPGGHHKTFYNHLTSKVEFPVFVRHLYWIRAQLLLMLNQHCIRFTDSHSSGSYTWPGLSGNGICRAPIWIQFICFLYDVMSHDYVTKEADLSLLRPQRIFSSSFPGLELPFLENEPIKTLLQMKIIGLHFNSKYCKYQNMMH